jgi:cyclopropane fatty-acyl-phospholipid synthase-like methyltransferase
VTSPPWFDDLVAAYDANAGTRELKGEPAWRDAARSDFAARLPPGGRILELGAGVGYTSRWFADRGFDILATDLSPENVARCRDKGLAAEVMDMKHLAVSPAGFDGIWAASCLMHIADADLSGVLLGVDAALAPDGWFWAGTWGGVDREGVWEEDSYEPKRFYSNRSDARMRSLYEKTFHVERFDVIDPEPDVAWHYQMALMRKRADG